MNIYTKSGDGGLSSTASRRQIPKSSPIFCLLGTLEELDAALGIAQQTQPAQTQTIVQALRQDLSRLGDELSGGERFASVQNVAGLEQSIDMMMQMVEQSGEAAPSGSNSTLELARAIARRAEREMVSCKQSGGISREAMMWLNRFSDLLYALARVHISSQAAAAAPIQERGKSTIEHGLWLCRRVMDRAREQGLAVVTAMCDAGGNAVCLLRDDSAYIASIDIAQNKAFTAVSLQMSTEQLGTLCRPDGPLYGVQNTNAGRIVIFGGGIPLYRNGQLIGGFGVSGGSAEQDTALAQYAEGQHNTAEEGGR